jgi:3-oxoacyl-[acyl-carrier protein] reductase
MAERILAGKVAIVTGAAEGIGYAIARRLGEAGASVVLNDVDAQAAQAAAVRLATLGPCIPAPGDVAHPRVAETLVRAAIRAFGRLDIAVANAGLTQERDFFEHSPADFDRLLGLNLRGSFFLAQAAARRFREQGEGGRLLLLSSVTGHVATPRLAAYGMTKAALEALARNLVIELSPHDITVNAVAPGATLTPRTLKDPAFGEKWSAVTPLRRAATTDDVASAALFLVSPAAAHVTGQSLVVDGGWTSLGFDPSLRGTPAREPRRRRKP